MAVERREVQARQQTHGHAPQKSCELTRAVRLRILTIAIRVIRSYVRLRFGLDSSWPLLLANTVSQRADQKNSPERRAGGRSEHVAT